MDRDQSESHWSAVGEQIRSRRDGNRLAGVDAPYFRYKAELMRETFLPRLDVKGRSVVDVGCGAGSSLAALRSLGPSRLAGCDQSAEMVALAQEHVPEAAVSLMDGQTLPYRDDEFDVANTVTVLQHNPDSRRATLIGELCRVAKHHIYLFEDTASPRVPGNEGSGPYGNYFGRPVEWYRAECQKHGWALVLSDSLATYVSMRTFNLLRRTMSRDRMEGQPLSSAHLAVERVTLPVTRRLDQVFPSRQWELTMMSFRPEAS